MLVFFDSPHRMRITHLLRRTLVPIVPKAAFIEIHVLMQETFKEVKRSKVRELFNLYEYEGCISTLKQL